MPGGFSLLACEREERPAEAGTDQRFHFLTSAMQLLAGAGDYQATMARIAQLAVPRFADWASVHVVEPTGGIRRVAVAHHDPARADLTRELMATFELDLSGSDGAPAALRTGRATIVQEISEDFLTSHVRDRRQREIYRVLGSRSGIAAPLIMRGRTVGVLTLLLGDSDRRYRPEDLELARDLAGLCAIAVDNAQRRQIADEALDQLKERARRLAVVAELGHAALAIADADAVMRRAVGTVAATLGVSHVAMVRLTSDGQAFETVAGVGWSDEVYRDRVPVGHESQAGFTMAVDGPVLARDLSIETRFTVPKPLRTHGIVSSVTVVVRSPDAAVGVLGAYSDQRRDFGDDEVVFLRSVGNVVGAAVARSEHEQARRRSEDERARLFAAEQQARALAEAAQARLAFLADASVALTESLDSRATIARVASLAVPRLADWCAVEVRFEPGVPERAAAHVDPRKVGTIGEVQRLYSGDVDAPLGVPVTIRTGESQLFSELPPDMVATGAESEEHARMLGELGTASVMVVPLAARDRVIGALTLVRGRSRIPFDHVDLALAEDLARRAAVAIDNARLYEEHERVANTLQASLLPPTNPEIPGLDVATAYRAAGHGIRIGGDFFDVFETAAGWAVAIGDVCGKGTEAAAITGLARHTLRAAAVREAEPGRLLAVVNDALLGQIPEYRFCTLAIAHLEHESMAESSGAVRINVACGGHPAPLILRRDGAVETMSVTGTLLGMFAGLSFEPGAARLDPGDLALFFTDGATEARSQDSILGDDGVATLLSVQAGKTAAEVVSSMEAEIVAFQQGSPRDDLALIAVRVPPADPNA